VAATLSQYPSFWQVWAERSAPKSKDSALALSFLASTFRGKSITWSQVIEEGLRAIFAEGGSQVCAPLRHLEPEVLGEVEFAPPPPMEFLEEEDFSLPDLPTPPPMELGAEAAKAYPAESPEQAIASVLADESVEPDDYYAEMPALAEEPQAPDRGEIKAAEPNLRTRTMADLLAEQGDYKGALDIFQELAAGASGPEAEELQGQVARMQAKMRRGGADAQGEKPIPPMPGKERLLTVLESLAERLESRARA
jgi:hypothetical protein